MNFDLERFLLLQLCDAPQPAYLLLELCLQAIFFTEWRLERTLQPETWMAACSFTDLSRWPHCFMWLERSHGMQILVFCQAHTMVKLLTTAIKDNGYSSLPAHPSVQTATWILMHPRILLATVWMFSIEIALRMRPCFWFLLLVLSRIDIAIVLYLNIQARGDYFSVQVVSVLGGWNEWSCSCNLVMLIQIKHLFTSKIWQFTLQQH